MITQSKYRLLIWFVFILLAMNIATIASLVYHTMHSNMPAATNISAYQSADQSALKGEQGAGFFRNQLNLDSEQFARFRDINREYHLSTQTIAYNLEKLRIEMVDEMEKSEPDTVRLNTICRKIGDNHEQLKKLTVDYYLKMKSSCRKDQQMRLNAIFRGMVQKEDTISEHQGKGYRWRWGRNK